ncbi:hypothetical protein ACTWKD_04145 [Halanaerobium saccharolyticum]|uniref:hypothetical protein n=1 Tax=Halanaerobium saccharolyticum TaxID=43595 RepID=UPI003FCD737F
MPKAKKSETLVSRFAQLNYAINNIHAQTARLIPEQGKLAIKIDQAEISKIEELSERISKIKDLKELEEELKQ